MHAKKLRIKNEINKAKILICNYDLIRHLDTTIPDLSGWSGTCEMNFGDHQPFEIQPWSKISSIYIFLFT